MTALTKKYSKDSIEKRITYRMQKAFSTKKDRKKAIHVAAVAGAGIVALLPIGLDAWALRVAEIIMVICIASSYGEKLTKSAAKGLLLSSFAQLAGETVAIAALEALEAGKVASSATIIGPIAAYGTKAGIAVGLIETVGNLVITYYERPNSLGNTACRTAEFIGGAADISRVIELFTSLSNILVESSVVGLGQTGSSIVSFKGGSLSESEKRAATRKAIQIEDKLREAKRIAEKANDSRKVSDINSAMKKVDCLKSNLITGKPTSSALNDAKKAIEKLK